MTVGIMLHVRGVRHYQGRNAVALAAQEVFLALMSTVGRTHLFGLFLRHRRAAGADEVRGILSKPFTIHLHHQRSTRAAEYGHRKERSFPRRSPRSFS